MTGEHSKKEIDGLTASTKKLLTFSTPAAANLLISKPLNIPTPASAITTPCTTMAQPTAGGPRRMTIFYTPDFNKHRPPAGRTHPECPQRLDVCVDMLKRSNDDHLASLLDWVCPHAVDEHQSEERRKRVLDAVRVVHRFPDYIDLLWQTSARGGGGLDRDTYVAPDSFEIALLAASTWMEAVDVAMDASTAAWALARPPGHHATPSNGMGFCLLSNAAIAAKYALDHKDISSVAILDFDVHHGNGTEASVINDSRIRFASSHQWPHYPGTGVEGHAGKYKNVLNINLEKGTGIEKYQSRFEKEMLPFLLHSDDGKPGLVIVSAGFDALDVDPLANLNFKPGDYRLFTQLLLEAAGKDMPIVFGLEGGYNLGEDGLGAAVRESIAGFCLPE